MMLDEVATKPRVNLTAQDRCDRCGAQAYAKATRDDLPEALLFCGHHRKDHEVALEVQGFTVAEDFDAWEAIAAGNLTAANPY